MAAVGDIIESGRFHWTYLYRAVDSHGQIIDFPLSAKRDAEAAKRFFRKALGQPHTVNPRTVTVDKNPAYPKAAADLRPAAASRLALSRPAPAGPAAAGRPAARGLPAGAISRE